MKATSVQRPDLQQVSVHQLDRVKEEEDIVVVW
jgi:hypothetical protein